MFVRTDVAAVYAKRQACCGSRAIRTLSLFDAIEPS
jgi:hypothetical protein